MRTFIALNLPADVRRAAHDALDPLRRPALPFRWLDGDVLHLTVRFLGDVEPAHVEPLGRALRTVASAYEPVDLRIAGLGAFPSLRRAATVWLGVEPDGSLIALHRGLETALVALGYPREQRPFRPHVTVARLRGGARAPDISRLAEAFTHAGTARVATIDLMRSHTEPAGARYEPLIRAPLRRAGES